MPYLLALLIAIALLVVWIGPYILVIVIVGIVIALLRYAFNQDVGNKEISLKDTKIVPPTKLKTTEVKAAEKSTDVRDIVEQQINLLNKFPDIAINSGNLHLLKVSQRLSRIQIEYYKSNNLYKTDLFSFIEKYAKERISTSKRSDVVKECESIIEIISCIKSGMIIEDIVYTKLSIAKIVPETQKEEKIEMLEEDSILMGEFNNSLLDEESLLKINQFNNNQWWNYHIEQKAKLERCRRNNCNVAEEIRLIEETISYLKLHNYPSKYWEMRLDLISKRVERSSPNNVKIISIDETDDNNWTKPQQVSNQIIYEQDWGQYHFQQKDKVNKYRQLGNRKEEIRIIEESIAILEFYKQPCEYWKKLLDITTLNHMIEEEENIKKNIISQIVGLLLDNAKAKNKQYKNRWVYSNSTKELTSTNTINSVQTKYKPSQAENTQYFSTGNNNSEAINISSPCIQQPNSDWITYHNNQKSKLAAYRKGCGDIQQEKLLVEKTIEYLKDHNYPYKYWEIQLRIINRKLFQLSNNDVQQCDNVELHNRQASLKSNIEENMAIDSINYTKKVILENSKCKPPYWADSYVFSSNFIIHANREQKEFYDYFKSQFLKGLNIDIENNNNYAFILMFDLCDTYKSEHKDINLLISQYQQLSSICPKVEKYTERILSEIEIDARHSALKNSLHKFNENDGQKCRWIKLGENISVKGFKLTRSLFYYGECFLIPKDIRKQIEWKYNNAYFYGPVLNPSLVVNPGEVEKRRFSSYEDMQPTLRYQYLQWLSGHLSIEQVPIDILLFYIYGLEVRMFVDDSCTMQERRQILNAFIEIESQILECGNNRVNECSNVLYLLKRLIDNSLTKYFYKEANEIFNEKELLKYYSYKDFILYEQLKDRYSLTPETAFEVAKASYMLSNIPVDKYESDIKERFIKLFNKHCKKFIVQKREKSEFCYRLHYLESRGSNYFIPEDIGLHYIENELDIYLWEAKNKFTPIIDQLDKDFWEYNRNFTPIRSNKLMLQFNLPSYINIVDTTEYKKVKKIFDSFIETTPFARICISDILKKLNYVKGDEKTITLPIEINMDNILGRLELRMFPMLNFDNKRLKFDDYCIIYKPDNQKRIERTYNYNKIEVFLKLIVYILQSKKSDTAEYQYVQNIICSLTPDKNYRNHLYAYFLWIVLKKQNLDKKTGLLIQQSYSDEECESLANLLIDITYKSGDVNPNKIKALTKVLSLLKFDSTDIHNQIHRRLTNESFASLIKKTDAVEYKIHEPKQIPSPKNSNISIDIERLAIYEKDTIDAQKLLANIFVEDVSNTVDANQIKSIDITEILGILVSKEVWNRKEIEGICKDRGLILGSVLEQINDFSYEKIGDSLLDDEGEFIYVTTEYKNQLI